MGVGLAMAVGVGFGVKVGATRAGVGELDACVGGATLGVGARVAADAGVDVAAALSLLVAITTVGVGV